MTSSVEFLGHVINEHCLSPMKIKLVAIHKVPSPHNVTELRSFIGLLNYYHIFLPNISTVLLLALMYALLKKNTKWHWSDLEEISCEKSNYCAMMIQINRGFVAV